jgi:hypothetical protein
METQTQIGNDTDLENVMALLKSNSKFVKHVTSLQSACHHFSANQESDCTDKLNIMRDNRNIISSPDDRDDLLNHVPPPHV